MAQQLIFTSVPRGLRPGTRGFTTAAASNGIPGPLMDRLEAMSGYTPAPGNPVSFACQVLKFANQRHTVLSRASAAPADYSGRSNLIAHHFVAATGELPPGSAVEVLAQNGLFRTAWEGDPQSLPPATLPRLVNSPAPCQAWAQVTGDAGWGGAIVRMLAQAPAKPVFVVFAPGQELLPLLAESLRLLPAARRSAITFNTYVSAQSADIECQIMGVAKGSELHLTAVKTQPDRVLDLTGPFGAPAADAFTEAARKGVTWQPVVVQAAAVVAPSVAGKVVVAPPPVAARVQGWRAPDLQTLVVGGDDLRLVRPPSAEAKRSLAWVWGVAAGVVLMVGVGGAFWVMGKGEEAKQQVAGVAPAVVKPVGQQNGGGSNSKGILTSRVIAWTQGSILELGKQLREYKQKNQGGVGGAAHKTAAKELVDKIKQEWSDGAEITLLKVKAALDKDKKDALKGVVAEHWEGAVATYEGGPMLIKGPGQGGKDGDIAVADEKKKFSGPLDDLKKWIKDAAEAPSFSALPSTIRSKEKWGELDRKAQAWKALCNDYQEHSKTWKILDCKGKVTFSVAGVSPVEVPVNIHWTQLIRENTVLGKYIEEDGKFNFDKWEKDYVQASPGPWEGVSVEITFERLAGKKDLEHVFVFHQDSKGTPYPMQWKRAQPGMEWQWTDSKQLAQNGLRPLKTVKAEEEGLPELISDSSCAPFINAERKNDSEIQFRDIKQVPQPCGKCDACLGQRLCPKEKKIKASEAPLVLSLKEIDNAPLLAVVRDQVDPAFHNADIDAKTKDVKNQFELAKVVKGRERSKMENIDKRLGEVKDELSKIEPAKEKKKKKKLEEEKTKLAGEKRELAPQLAIAEAKADKWGKVDTAMQNLATKVADWNAAHPPGTKLIFYDKDGEPIAHILFNLDPTDYLTKKYPALTEYLKK